MWSPYSQGSLSREDKNDRTNRGRKLVDACSSGKDSASLGTLWTNQAGVCWRQPVSVGSVLRQLITCSVQTNLDFWTCVVTLEVTADYDLSSFAKASSTLLGDGLSDLGVWKFNPTPLPLKGLTLKCLPTSYNLYQLMKSLTKRPLGKKSHATCLHAQHLASPHVASLVLTLPSPRHVGGGHQLQTGIASRFPAHAAHACLEKPRKQPSEVAAVSRDCRLHQPPGETGVHIAILPYKLRCHSVLQAGHDSGLQTRWHTSSEAGEVGCWASSNVSPC